MKLSAFAHKFVNGIMPFIEKLKRSRIDDEMVADLEAYLEELLAKHEGLAVSSLTRKEVERIFEISQDQQPPTWCSVQNNIQLSPEYASVIEYEHSKQRAADQKTTNPKPMTESTVRITLNHLLYGTLKAVQMERPVTGREMFLETEALLAWSPVRYHLRKRCLHGYTDYTLWYGPKQQMETNLVVWEVKRAGATGTGGEAQLLAYMAIVRRHRLKLRKRDSTVYGILSDNELFQFFRLDRWGRYSIHPVRCVPPRYEEVVRLLGHIIMEASKQSPHGSEETDPMVDPIETSA